MGRGQWRSLSLPAPHRAQQVSYGVLQTDGLGMDPPLVDQETPQRVADRASTRHAVVTAAVQGWVAVNCGRSARSAPRAPFRPWEHGLHGDQPSNTFLFYVAKETAAEGGTGTEPHHARDAEGSRVPAQDPPVAGLP